MPNPTAQFISLDKIVRQAIDDVGDTAEHQYVRFLGFAFKAVKEINYDISGHFVATTLTAEANNTVILPDNFIDWVSVGVISEGRVVFFHNKDCHLTQEANDAHTNIDTDYQGCCLDENENWFRLYKELGIIEFSSDVEATNIYLSYLATELELNNETLAHVYAEEMIIARIHWERVRNNSSANYNEKVLKQREYETARRIARGRLSNITAKSIIDSASKQPFNNLLDRLLRIQGGGL